MKKLLILFLLICLVACSKETEVTDSEDITEEVDDVEQVSDTQDDFVSEETIDNNIDVYADLKTNPNYIETNLDEYAKYYGDFNDDRLIKLVNEGIINDDNHDVIMGIYECDYYVDRLEDKYLEYVDEYGDARKLVEIVNTNRYEPLYTDIKTTDLSKNYLMLINKYHQLPSDYEPSDLVEIESNYGRGSTRADVYTAFKNMATDALEAGYTLTITSAYRSYDYQDGLYNKYLDLEGGNQAAVDSYSARPGHSEHQSGLCLDLVTPGYSMDDFGLSDASKWVDENCYKYGFIIRYTKEKENITGYEAEPWQVRYVGDVDIAKYIRDTGISFDEYYTCFVE